MAFAQALNTGDWRAPSDTVSPLPSPPPPPAALAARGLQAVGGHAVPVKQLEALDEALREGFVPGKGVTLSDVADDRVRGFSLGMRQRLGLAAALLTRPRLLVLDEPANGLDPAGSRLVYRVLHDLAADGTSVILSSHRMDDLAALCSEVTLLLTGRVVFSGPVAELAAESGELDHRLRTSDRAATLGVAAATPGIRVLPPDPVQVHGAVDTCVVRGDTAAIDHLVERLVAGGVAVRELTPVVSPLEAAFLALTDGDATTGADT